MRSEQLDFLINKYKGIDELIELERLISFSDEDQFVNRDSWAKEQTAVKFKKLFEMIIAFYHNLDSMSFEDKVEFVLRHEKVDVRLIKNAFDLDEEKAKKIFHYLQLSDVGKCVEDFIEIENKEKCKQIFTTQLLIKK